MRIILVPIFKVLLLIVILTVCLLAYISTIVIVFLWEFKMTKYSEIFNNHGNITVSSGIHPKRQDNNLKETIIRMWNLDFYDC